MFVTCICSNLSRLQKINTLSGVEHLTRDMINKKQVQKRCYRSVQLHYSNIL